MFKPDLSGEDNPGDVGGFRLYSDEKAEARAREEREFDLRVKMFALDMAVQALPSLVSSLESEERKFVTLRHATAEFEKILRGEPTS
jgi:hypothetical protein